MTTVREEASRLADLLRREHHALAEFLIALAAFDRERRWVVLGYRTLFAFLRRELHLSAGAAQYRKTAAELNQKFPEVEAALRDGKLCLSSVVEVAKVLTAENVAQVLPRFFGLSSRDAAFVAASLRPVENPPVRDFIVTPVRADAPAAVTAGDRAAPSASTASDVAPLFRAPEVDASARALPAAPPPARPASVPAATTIEPLDGERARVHMTVSRRLLDKLESARDALSHSHPGASREEIIEAGFDLLLERTARRRGLVKNPRKLGPDNAEASASKAATTVPAKDPGRYVAADIRRAIWERDQGKCQWPIDGGGICGSTCRVELDHAVKPFAKGGRITKPEDGRILCDFHQDVSARREYGDDLMNHYTRSKGGTCSEPVAVYRPPPRREAVRAGAAERWVRGPPPAHLRALPRSLSG